MHASPLFADAVARLLLRVDEALGHPEPLDLVDVGAGEGELLTGVLAALRTREAAGGEVAARLRPVAVERRARPARLDPAIGWQQELPEPGTCTGGCCSPTSGWTTSPWTSPSTTRRAPRGWCWWSRTVPSGPVPRCPARTRTGWPAGGRPRRTVRTARGPRSGIRGTPRGARAASALRRGAAVAVDYAHRRADRPPFGTLTGFRAGHDCRPVPDGSCDLTSHVALDAVAAAAPGSSTLLTQRAALRALGVTGRRPPLSLASGDPAAYVRELGAAGAAAELLDPGGLGGFGWLVCEVECSAGPWE